MTSSRSKLIVSAYKKLMIVGNAHMDSQQEQAFHEALFALRTAYPVIDEEMEA